MYNAVILKNIYYENWKYKELLLYNVLKYYYYYIYYIA